VKIIWLLVLAPFACFLTAFAAGAMFLRQILKSGPGTIRQTDNGPELHWVGNLGALDIQRTQKSDPQLASMLKYPGAAPVFPRAEDSQIRVRIGKRQFGTTTRSYWTSDPAEVVWEFYRRELPGWTESVHCEKGQELIDPPTGRAISIVQEPDRTLIECCVSARQTVAQ
jgi:hypothetical protein